MTPTRDMIVTAIVNVIDIRNQVRCCRVVLDTGSSSNFITEEFARKLILPFKKFKIPVVTIDNTQTATNYLVTARVQSRTNGWSRTLHFLTVKSIGGFHPAEPINRNAIPIPKNIALADPTFDQPAPVEMLLSSGTTLSLMCQGQITVNAPQDPDLILQKTQLGWIIGGSTLISSSQSYKHCYITNAIPDISKFWEIEDTPNLQHFSQEEQSCEEHFKAHTIRNPNGRYEVALPFNNQKADLGESRSMALKRINALERKLRGNPELQKQYTAVLQEYIDLGHMTEVQGDISEKGFYLPHHAVIKTTSLTTKVRVVFDGSAVSTTGLSLNDTLMIGPKIQCDIFVLLTRFRQYDFVLTGDIEKMYRMFKVREDDRKYQRIFWRNSREEIAIYELNTITFGTSSAPYQAIKCVQQLAEDEGDEHPVASEILTTDMYVDDLLTGANTFEEALHIRNDVTAALKKGGLNIRQWASNDPKLLQGLPEASINLQLMEAKDMTIKTLGIHWNSKEDAIVYTIRPIDMPQRITKRNILSETAKIFDPLGLLGPVVLTAKLIVQKLWQEKLDWDESIPLRLRTEWIDFASQLPRLNQLSVPRQATSRESQNIQLHGFCDASLEAYGACIYIRTINHVGIINTQLLCAKSRVAPKHTTLTILRLELCAALLLADLYKSVQQAVKHEFDSIHFWSDSMVTLYWINTNPHKLLPFVANRVSGIIEKTKISYWKHVSSKDNPADHISRGRLPDEFLHISIWITGPSWLNQEETMWPRTKLETPSVLPEQRKATCLFLVPSRNEFLERFSSFTTLKRITAYCLRFKGRNRNRGSLTTQELTLAHNRIITMVQAACFTNEKQDLQKGNSVRHQSKLAKLNPFLNNNGLIRVGGRLTHADIPYEQQHPIILPKGQHVTTLIIRQEHYTYLHAGAQTTLYSLRQRYWILDGRNEVRKIIRNCAKCQVINATPIKTIMGNIPKVRLTKARPFCNVGVDYCGPFYIKEKKLRNRNRVKVWVAIFICMVVKAVHLEVVSDLTTEGFIATLKRFIARRGKPTNIYSDNGTNFAGANHELKELYQALQAANKTVQKHLTDQGITWHFTPPLSPNFGGLWEAGVKSFKHHMKRVVNDLLSFEQFNTFVIEIEAILNSRPLTPISTDPNDLLVLTPGHFLIGDTLTGLPETDFSLTPSNRLSVWQHIQKLKQNFWTRWHKEYINELHVRSKWFKGSPNLQVGTIVIMKEEHLPPRQWALGRIVKTFPGSDGVVRVVRVKTARGEFNRNVRKLAHLLTEDEVGESKGH